MLVLGSGFSSMLAARCRFEMSDTVAIAHHVSHDQMRCVSPSSSRSGPSSVQVSMNGQQFVSSDITFTFRAAVQVSSIWPSVGSATGGIPVTVLGSGFSAAAQLLDALQCRFNLTSTQARHLSESQLVCDSPMSSPGLMALEVSTNGQDFSSSGVLYESVTVAIEELAPWLGPTQGGTHVVISGPGLARLPSLHCQFAPVSFFDAVAMLPWLEVAASTFDSRQVTCRSPSGISTGWSRVELVQLGKLLQSTGSFYVHASILISQIIPSVGPVGGGTRVVVFGSGFVTVTTLRCRFHTIDQITIGRALPSADMSNATRIECSAPPSSGAGSRALEVSMNGQQFSDSGITFTYYGLTAVSYVSPTRGAAEGGTPLTVFGNGFSRPADGQSVQVRFNTSIVQGSYVSEDSIRCFTTSLPSGPYIVEVSNNGVDYTSSNVHFLVVTITLRHVTPWLGPVSGGTIVTLAGSNLDTEHLRCRIDGLESLTSSVPATALSSYSSRCIIPGNHFSGWSALRLLSHDVPLQSAVSFYLHAQLFVSELVPNTGPVEGGSYVVVSGAGFSSMATLMCRFGLRSATLTARVISDEQAVCTSPRYPEDSVQMVAVSLNGQQFSNGLPFTYLPATIVSFISPSHGPIEGGTLLAVFGSGLSGVQHCRLNTTAVIAEILNETAVRCTTVPFHPGSVMVEICA
jgi:hypothetical protein